MGRARVSLATAGSEFGVSLLGGAHTISVMIYSGLDDEELEALVRHLVSGALHAAPPAGRKRFNAGMNRRQH